MARLDTRDKVSRPELSLLCRQFGGMLNAGIDLLRILDVLGQQTNNPKLKEVLLSVQKDVSLGRLLSTAFGRFPEIFSPFFLSMLRQGEQDDVLDAALVKLAEHLEHDGDSLGGDAGGRMVVRSELDFSLHRLWPLLFWMAVGTAIVCVAIAGLWYATNAGTFAEASLGPNVLLLVGLLIFLLSLIFARFGPVRAVVCSFCGKAPDADEAMISGRGAAICQGCLAQNYQYLALRQPVAEEPATKQLELPKKEEVVEIEEDIIEESDFEIIKSEEGYV